MEKEVIYVNFVIEQGKWDSEKARKWKVTLSLSVVAFCGASTLNYHVPLVCRLSSQPPSAHPPAFFISFSIF